MIILQEMTTKKEMKAFVKFPFKLYKDNPYWVPPIINDEISSFDKTKNPVFEHAEARFFVAKKNNEVVGRVAAIINYTEIKKQKLKKMRFGWFDFIDDIEVSTLLLQKVEEIGVQNNLEFMEGPVGFSNLDKVGVLTEGFDHIGTMITWYNHAYYKTHLEKLGFNIEKEYLESKFLFKNVKREPLERVGELIKKRYHLTPLNFTKTKEIFPYVDKMFDLFNESYAALPSFVPISEREKEYFKKKYISFINPEYIKFVVDKNGDMIAFAITMPSFSEALQKANGKLFPFGIFHLLKAKNNSKDALFYLIGVHPEHQNKGIHALLFLEFQKSFEPKGIINCIRTPELASNEAIAAVWKNFDSKVYKRRCTYKKVI
ncbi:MAG: GTP cyclohydrolase [Lutibacter sp.]|uniref:GTP cyclohydrolase n=1 Tax=Lutibacter sp. TaxID=1925666 RepID=UPI0017A11290|nr:GTP cyclohydrolase [Lutibacter sp.]MBT8317516.1 GTP cyclohydrolase [Lutibacter sp.]NNJ58375.1 GTP cyclohydrolase [Lutibacter sp.]